MTSCGPYTCNFPAPWTTKWRGKWRCSNCGTMYRRGRRIKTYRSVVPELEGSGWILVPPAMGLP